MEQIQKLFDVFERTDARPASYSESQYVSLNRLAWRNVGLIRSVLDDWFSRDPIDHGASLRSRFRSRKDDAHKGAFFELLLHELLVRLGRGVEVEPETTTSTMGRPDFGATLGTEDIFYLEATVSGVQSVLDYTPIENSVLDELNQLDCPDFWLAADFDGTLVSTPPLGRIRSELQKWVDGLDYRKVTAEGGIKSRRLSHSYEHDGWTLEVSATPRGQTAQGKAGTRPLGMPPGFVGRRTSFPLLKRRLPRKQTNTGNWMPH